MAYLEDRINVKNGSKAIITFINKHKKIPNLKEFNSLLSNTNNFGNKVKGTLFINKGSEDENMLFEKNLHLENNSKDIFHEIFCQEKISFTSVKIPNPNWAFGIWLGEHFEFYTNWNKQYSKPKRTFLTDSYPIIILLISSCALFFFGLKKKKHV